MVIYHRKIESEETERRKTTQHSILCRRTKRECYFVYCFDSLCFFFNSYISLRSFIVSFSSIVSSLTLCFRFMFSAVFSLFLFDKKNFFLFRFYFVLLIIIYAYIIPFISQAASVWFIFFILLFCSSSFFLLFMIISVVKH